MVWTHGHTMRGPVILVVVLAMLAACGCLQRPQPAGDYDAAEGEDERMSTPIELERKLAAGDWSAVELAGQLGQTAWPTIQKAAGLPQYRSRQIAMACAGRLGGEAAGPILSAGLGDANGNVRLAAAKALSVAPPPSAGHAIRAVLTASPELEIRGLLALAAGYLPGEPTVEILRPLSQRDDVLAERARMALAKLGDAPARQAMAADLASPEPRMRYEVLGQLRYVADPALASHAKRLLADRAEALQIGPPRNPRYRRVCDQAVDTLVALLNLSPKFQTSVEKVYSDAELETIRSLAK